MRCRVASTGSGTLSPRTWLSRPASVARTSGLRTSVLQTLPPPWRASGYTAAVLATGTMKPVISAASARPGASPMREASASVMYELN